MIKAVLDSALDIGLGPGIITIQQYELMHDIKCDSLTIIVSLLDIHLSTYYLQNSILKQLYPATKKHPAKMSTHTRLCSHAMSRSM